MDSYDLQYLKTFKKFIACVVITLWVVFVIACKQEKPLGILSHEDMARAIMDVYITEQRVSSLDLRADSSKIVFEKLRWKLLGDSTQDSLFRKSFDYYIDKPRELELIYTAVVDSLNLQEQRVIAMDTIKANAIKADSIKVDSIKKLK